MTYFVDKRLASAGNVIGGDSVAGAEQQQQQTQQVASSNVYRASTSGRLPPAEAAGDKSTHHYASVANDNLDRSK